MNTEPTKPAQEEEEDSRVRQIVDLGSSVVTNDHGTVHCLTVIGQIEGHGQAPSGTKTTKYEHVLPLLASIEESQEVDGLLVLLHTMGGDVEAGLAIAEMIAGMTKPTVTLVLGGGHSIGIPLAVAAISKELLHWTDTYVIDVADGRDGLCALMVVLAIDAEKCSHNS